MTSAWPLTRLDSLLQRSHNTIEPAADTEYKEITVRMWGKGVVERGRIVGSGLSGRRYIARTGQFIISRIDARHGAMGLVPPSLENSLVTNDFPLFNLNTILLEPSFFAWLCRTANFVQLCRQASEGTTNRVRLKEEQFLSLELPLPPLTEQRRVVAQIEELAAHINEALKLRRQAIEEAGALLAASSLQLFNSLKEISKLGSVCEVIDPNPSHRYPTYVDEGVPIISSSEFIGEDGIDSRTAKHVPMSFYESTLGRFGVGGGDVIFSRKGKVGYARLHPTDMQLAMTHTLCVLKADRLRLDPRYLLHFTRSPVFLEELASTMNPNVGVPTLGLGVIRDAKIPVPRLSEQHRIVAELDSLHVEIDELKRLQSEISAQLDAMLPAILDKAFKGEL